MIDRVQNIENVGRIVKTGGGQAQYQFGSNTHIYAGNTHGKSTLTAVMRSLQSNSPDFIKGRKTFGVTQQQRAIFVIGGVNYIFDGNEWEKSFENIRIFDTRYIHENFFSPDEEITEDGQKKIETFILGSEGVRLAKDVVDLTVKQRENATNLASITREYNATRPFDHPIFEEFLKVDETQDIDNQIDEHTKQLNSFKNQEGICSQLSAMIASLSGVDLVSAKSFLEPALKVDISKITSHIHDNMPEDTRGVEAKEFLRQGLQFYSDQGACPFCAQNTDNDNTQELLRAYGDYFSESYNTMAQNRHNQEQYFTRWDVVSKLRKGVIELAKLDVAIDLNGVDEKIEEAISAFIEEIEKKKDFAYSVNFASLDALQDGCTTLSSALQMTLGLYDGDLSDKIKITKETLRDIEVAKKRHSEPWKTKAENYQDLKTENDTVITPQLNAAVEAQSSYANSVFSGCMNTVNDCLESLGVNFKVQNLSYKGRTRNDLFTLVFDDTHTVGISAGSRVSTHTSKHTLSESDRRALCFAFFVASVMSDPKCSELIVVLDDPVSSFDSDRRNSTVKFLRQLRESATTPCQFITLTHDKDFLRTLASDIRDGAANLMLEWNPGNNTSDFALLDTSTHPMFMDEYYRKLKELEQYLLLPDSSLNTGHLQNVRHVIENIMKRKYYNLLLDNIRNKKSLETFIETLSAPGKPYENNQVLIARIRSLLPHEVHHDQDNPGGYDISAIGATDIRRIIADTLSVIQSI
jgi:wobble nucleotide-excising tRNase